MAEKRLIWLGSSLDDLRAFPPEARRSAGYQLSRERLPDAVYVLHAFEKRTRQTPRADIELARSRLAELMRVRSKRKER